MAVTDFTQSPAPQAGYNAEGAFVYQMRLDALRIVAQMNISGDTSLDAVKHRLVFVQRHLIDAAMMDPAIPPGYRPILVRLMDYTIRECVTERRGERRRNMCIIDS